MAKTPTTVLFVCLGNICRSPLAEGIFANMAGQRGLADRFRVDSAGTAGYHAGEPPDRRSLAVAGARGVQLPGVSRQITRRDLAGPVVVVAMDRDNRRHLERLCPPGSGAKIVMMRDYDPAAPGADVPDPYYGGTAGFQEVYDILERSCQGLLDDLANRHPG